MYRGAKPSGFSDHHRTPTLEKYLLHAISLATYNKYRSRISIDE